MAATPEVSVIIPVFRRQEPGVAALRSVLAQTGVDLEVVLVDDGSPEPFALPADLKDHPAIRLIRQPNGGPAAARNCGIGAARGDWIAFLDSDDLWRPGKLSGQLAFGREKDASDDAALCAIVCGFSQVDEAVGRRRDRIPVASASITDFASGCWFAPGSTTLVRRRAFAVVGEMDRALRRLEDLDWFLRLALAGGRIESWPHIGVDVRVGGYAQSATVDAAAAHLRLKWLGRGQLPRGAGRRLRAYLALEQAVARYRNGKTLASMVWLVRSWLLAPRAGIHLKSWWHSWKAHDA